MEQESYSRRVNVISSEANKRVVQVEWRFITSSGSPHLVVLKHSQTNNLKTQKVLYVDGDKHYNKMSYAKTLRVEKNSDVFIVNIEKSNGQERYKYKLLINETTFDKACKEWKKRRKA